MKKTVKPAPRPVQYTVKEVGRISTYNEAAWAEVEAAKPARDKRQAEGYYTMIEAAEIMAAAHGIDAELLLMTHMHPAFLSGDLIVLDPRTKGPVKGRSCRDFHDWVTPENMNSWLERAGFSFRWPDARKEVKPALPWWRNEYKILEMAQNIGARLHDKRSPTSNTAIAKEIASHIYANQRGKASDKRAPSWDTVRGVLTGWHFKPGRN